MLTKIQEKNCTQGISLLQMSWCIFCWKKLSSRPHKNKVSRVSSYDQLVRTSQALFCILTPCRAKFSKSLGKLTQKRRARKEDWCSWSQRSPGGSSKGKTRHGWHLSRLLSPFGSYGCIQLLTYAFTSNVWGCKEPTNVIRLASWPTRLGLASTRML